MTDGTPVSHDPYYAFFPVNYFESSEGNFKYATIDSNFIRITETLVVVQVVTIVVFIILKTVSSFMVQIKYTSQGFYEFKKRTSRFLKFMFTL